MKNTPPIVRSSSLRFKTRAPAGRARDRVLRCSALAIACLATALQARASNCLTPPTGFVSCWQGEGNANDAAGLNNGMVQPGTTFAPGVVELAFDFNPSSGTVIVPDSASLRLTNQLTIEAWINTRANTDPDGYAIVSKLSYPTGNNGYQFIQVGNTIQGLFNSPDTSWPSQRIISPPIINTGVWYHVAWTYDQSAMKLYCNGQLVASNAIGAHPIATSSSDLHISGVDSSHTYFDGLIDEASIYSRALSSSEIAAIYNAGAAGKCFAPSIVTQPHNQLGYWGKGVTFNVEAKGSVPLSYQWQKDNNPITGATDASLVLTNLQMADAGNYSVVVANFVSSITSSNALLTMNPAGVSVDLYTGVTINGVVGLTYGIQYNTNLNNTNGWHGAANVTLGAPTQLWFDVQPATQPQRYYRVVPGPITIP